jgi:hypothetical protein
MKTPSDDEIVATRIFDRKDGPVRLSFCKPNPDPDPRYDADPDAPPWRCAYAIDFPDSDSVRGYALGVDSIQALLLAFASAAGRLRYVGDGTSTVRPPLQWHGQDDLGLAIPSFE